MRITFKILTEAHCRVFVTFCGRCVWDDKMCEPEYISSTLTDMGLCYTFNANPDNILHSDTTGNYLTGCGIYHY